MLLKSGLEFFFLWNCNFTVVINHVIRYLEELLNSSDKMFHPNWNISVNKESPSMQCQYIVSSNLSYLQSLVITCYLYIHLKIYLYRTLVTYCDFNCDHVSLNILVWKIVNVNNIIEYINCASSFFFCTIYCISWFKSIVLLIKKILCI